MVCGVWCAVVVWCGVVWCGVFWCGVVRCGGAGGGGGVCVCVFVLLCMPLGISSLVDLAMDNLVLKNYYIGISYLIK